MGGPGAGRVKVTRNQKVLVHLLAYVRYADRDVAPLPVTQQGIADALRVRRSHVTLALQALERRGLAVHRTMRVLGGTRRKRAYSLTPHGHERAREAEAGLASMPVVLFEEPPREVVLGRVHEHLGAAYTLRDLLAAVRPDGVLDPSRLNAPGALG